MMAESVDMDDDVTLAGEALHDAFLDETQMGQTADDTDLAWSAEEHTLDIGQPRRHWPLWAALVVMLCLVTGAAVWLATVFYQERWNHPIAQVETPQTAPPAPTPTEIGAPEPLPSPGPPVQHEQPPVPAPDPDQQFLAEVSLIPGTSITDGQELITSTKVMCTELQNGKSAESEIEGTMRNTGISRGQAEQLFDAGTTIYCPKFAHR